MALLMTPVIEGWDYTYENSAIVAPLDRRVHFGQEDHVRYYGADLRKRIADAGFSLREFTANEPQVHTYGLFRGTSSLLRPRRDGRADPRPILLSALGATHRGIGFVWMRAQKSMLN